MEMATKPQTEDDRIIETLVEHLPHLNDIGEGPALDEDILQSHGTMSVDDTRGTAYGDHLQEFHGAFEALSDDLKAYGDVAYATVGNRHDYDVPECDFLIEADPVLTWSDDLLTQPVEEADPNEDYDQASVMHRIVDLRAGGRERLFELHVDYYTTGEVHTSLSLTPGDTAKSTRSGGDRLETTSVFTGRLGDIDMEAVQDDIEAMRPFVLSRVLELGDEQDAKLAHARTMALSECGVSDEEIADRLGIGESTVRGYKSKFTTETRNAERRFVANSPVPKTIIAEHSLDITHELAERWYICRTTAQSAYDQQNPYSLTIVTEDLDSFGVDLSVETTTYSSLGSLIRSVYANESFSDEQRAEAVRNVMRAIPEHRRAEADFETLPSPHARLDARVP